MNYIDLIEKEIQPLRDKLTSHELYQQLSDIEDVRIFMETHVYAVWDFMSLLKALQHQLTCLQLPWKPSSSATLSRFINEIVWGEESDVNEAGVPMSHFEMYLDAMREVGADTTKITDFVEQADSLQAVFLLLERVGLSDAIKQFLHFTFSTIRTGAPHKIASAFTFGREDLIPDMFIEIINRSHQEDNQSFPKLTYYLNRHIEVDGDEHGPLSLAMVEALCGQDKQKWEEVKVIAQEALKQRILLWDAITEQIKHQKLVPVV